MISVAALSVTPVKGTRLHRVGSVELRSFGAVDDRRLFVIDARDRMVNSKRLGQLQTVVADLEGEHLTLTFPDGSRVEDVVELGASLLTRFYSRELAARLVEGPWAHALSAHVGEPVRLVAPERGAVDRGSRGAASLVSRASLAALADAAGRPDVDSRRFRMLIEIDGVNAHEEDRWVGREVQVGEASVRFGGHVGRCLITSRDPDTGKVDLPTLDILGEYRGDIESTEPLPFGIYGEVVNEGTVRVGDRLTVVQ